MDKLLKQAIQVSALMREWQRAYYACPKEQKARKLNLLRKSKALESRLDSLLPEIFRQSPDLKPESINISKTNDPIQEWLAK